VAQDCDNLHQASKRDNDSLKNSSCPFGTAKQPKKFTVSSRFPTRSLGIKGIDETIAKNLISPTELAVQTNLLSGKFPRGNENPKFVDDSLHHLRGSLPSRKRWLNPLSTQICWRPAALDDSHPVF